MHWPRLTMWWETERIALAVVVGSFFISAAYAFYWRVHPVVDAQAYDQIAVNLSAGYGFRENRAKSYDFDWAMIRAGPGYEFFLAGVYAVFGHHYQAVWLGQALLHALSAWLLYAIAIRVWPVSGRRVGLIAAALFGFSPDMIEIAAMLMTETLYLFFIILTIYIFIRLLDGGREQFWSALLGLVTAFSILTRPTVALFVPIFLWFYWQKRDYSSLAMFSSLLGLALSPWVARNYLLYHQFILTTLIGEYNLWIGNTLASDGGQISGGFNPVTTFIEQHGVASLASVARSEFWSLAMGQPLVFIKLCLLRLIRYFSLMRPMGFWFYQQGLGQLAFVAASALHGGILFLSGYSGLWLAVREKKPAPKYLIALVLTVPLPLLITVVQSRYRFAIYPFLALFGAYCIDWARARPGWWKQPSVLLPAFGLGLVSLVDLFLNLGKIVERTRLFF